MSNIASFSLRPVNNAVIAANGTAISQSNEPAGDINTVTAAAKANMFLTLNERTGVKVFSYGELLTDYSAFLRAIADINKVPGVIPIMGITAAACMVLGPIYANNGLNQKRDGEKTGNNKEIQNGILGTIKGISLTCFGAAAVTFRGLTLAAEKHSGLTKATNISGHVFTGVGTAFFTVAFIGLVRKIYNIFTLKLKMWGSLFKTTNSDAEQFAIIAKKFFTSQVALEREAAIYKKLSSEEKETFKAEVFKWINDTETALNDSSKNASIPIEVRSAVRDQFINLKGALTNAINLGNEDLMGSLYGAIRLGSRKQQKMEAHLGTKENRAYKTAESAKAILAKLDPIAVRYNFANFEDAINKARNGDAAAKAFLKNDSNFVEVATEMKTFLDNVHRNMTESINGKILPAFSYGLGIALWILGALYTSGPVALAVSIGWIAIAVMVIYLDGKDLYDSIADKLNTKEDKWMFALNVIAALALIATCGMTIMSGGTLPILFSTALAVAFVATYAFIKMYSGNAMDKKTV